VERVVLNALAEYPEGFVADFCAFGEYPMASSSEKPIHLFLNATVTSI